MDVFLHFESQAHAKQQVQITCAAAWLLNQKKYPESLPEAIFQYMFDTLNNGPSANNTQHVRKVVQMSDRSCKDKALCNKDQNWAEQTSWEHCTGSKGELISCHSWNYAQNQSQRVA